MKKVIIIIVLTIFSIARTDANEANNPVADSRAVVIAGNARFTVLTDRLIRMEWAEDGRFEDNATLAILNRNLPVPAFTKTEKDGKLTIITQKIALTYIPSGEFSSDNLSVSFTLNGKKVTWHPGDNPSGNLKGTARTLDGCHGFDVINNRENKMDDGILSRDGWAVVDESARHLLVKDDSDWREWVAERPEGKRQDLYMFAYGHDYKAALGDFIKVAGRIPLPPKYTFGYWWSRYWIYTDDELKAIGSDMRSHNIPMDVFIIDMDWHLTWKDLKKRKGMDEFGERPGWTGYTWNKDLIPNPKGLLSDLHGMEYKIALNLHPASGIRPLEDCYEDFVKDYLSRTSVYDGPEDYVYGEGGYKFAGNDKATGSKGYSAPVPFRLDQKAWADAYFNSVIHPLERLGVDFWWLDWQQWFESKYVKNLSNTFWCNYTFFNDKVRQSRSQGLDATRPFIYHRWGGLGSHRYQIGFSGDTYDEWDVLAFLPYFTSTASNVGYGYWGHDIGGHMQKKDHKRPTEPEMYTRWLQYGVFTPIFKTHSTQSANLERQIWKFPSHMKYMKEAIELRYALSDYIYDAAREAYDSGISMTRPLYYEYPEDDRAYSRNQEFMFGDRILATVLCKPVDANGLTEREMWFPAGNDWYDMAKHVMVKGGSTRKLYYSISENPWYVKAGAVLPLAPNGLKNLQHIRNDWRILVVPGNGKSEYTRYEDDGLTQNYVNDYATTLIRKNSSGGRVSLTVDPRKGSYKGAPQTRKLSIILEGWSKIPASIKLNGQAATTSAGVSEAVTVSIEGGSAVIDLPELPVSERIAVEIVR